jgi:hypothetical protein
VVEVHAISAERRRPLCDREERLLRRRALLPRDQRLHGSVGISGNPKVPPWHDANIKEKQSNKKGYNLATPAPIRAHQVFTRRQRRACTSGITFGPGTSSGEARQAARTDRARPVARNAYLENHFLPTSSRAIIEQ